MEKYENLKHIMVVKNLKQSEVAEAIGMDRTTFNIKLNRYDGRDFKLSEAVKISEFLEVSINDFF